MGVVMNTLRTLLLLASVAVPIAMVLPTEPAAARNLDHHAVFGVLPAECLLDYSNLNEPRMVIKNISGHTLRAGSKVSWTAGEQRGSLYLQQSLATGETLSFGVNAKGYDCAASVAGPELMVSE
jgi:hypothetical protein